MPVRTCGVSPERGVSFILPARKNRDMNASSVELTTPPSREIEPVPAVLIDPRGEGPIRAERLGLEGLEARAARLASACVLAPPRRARSPLLRRFVENKRVLNQVHRQLVAVGDRRHLPGIDAEWLVDNFHIIADSLREVRHDLPPGYDELLPKLAVPPLIGYPRVYALALALVAHSDSELDEARIVRFVRAFQQAAPLTHRRALGPADDAPPGPAREPPPPGRADDLGLGRAPPRRAMGGRGPGPRQARSLRPKTRRPSRASTIGRGPRSPPPAAPLPDFGGLTDPFVVRLMQLLRDQEGASEAFDHLEAELAAQGTDPNEVLRREHHAQAANQVTVGNCVLSLRLLSAIDWNAFFEQSSRVEAILREDPSGVYPQQDFATSDRYRRTVETISRGSGADEIEVARRAIELARQARRVERPAPATASRATTSGSTWSTAAGRSSRPRSATGPAARAALRLGAGASGSRPTSARSRRCSSRSWSWRCAWASVRRPARGG